MNAEWRERYAAWQRVTASAATASSTPAARSKSQQAYHWIKERIVERRIRLGLPARARHRSPRELGVSAVPVREAIRMLEAEGLVTFERNVGAQVAMVDEGEYVSTMQTLEPRRGRGDGAVGAAGRPPTIWRAPEPSTRR